MAAHLVAAGALADEEPELAWRHARAARARGGRIGVVRETVGLVAYRAGEWAEAIGELRAARRMGGGPGHLAVMADCERALGHPERAIELSRSTEADALDPEAATELQIVVAGARADLGQVDAALAQIQRLGLDKAEAHPRLAYAYADLLLKADRRDEALGWFIRSANADLDEETDALERLAELGVADAEPHDADESLLIAAGGELGDAPAAIADSGARSGTLETETADTGDPDGAVEQADAQQASQGKSDQAVHPDGTEAAEVDVAGSDGSHVDSPVGTATDTVDDGVTRTEFTDTPVAEPEVVDDDGKIIPTVVFSDDPQTGDR